MNVLFSDLDNTLIYSHRRMTREEGVPVEQLNGQDQSYMTAATFSFFRNLDWITFVPVTTRSEVQFRRLAVAAPYALICNGGKLLVDGAEDPAWTAETLERVHDDIPELERCAALLGKLSGSELHAPEAYYYYVRAEDPENVCAALTGQYPDGRIGIGHDRQKVYLFPRDVNKGRAVRRFMDRFGTDVTVGAGDSLMDVPMLNETDYALAAERICGMIHGPAIRLLEGEMISDQICTALSALRREGIL